MDIDAVHGDGNVLERGNWQMKTTILRKMSGSAGIALLLVALTPAYASASTPNSILASASPSDTANSALREPTRNCGSAVALNRNGVNIRVTGVSMGQFMPQGVDYAVSSTYEEDGTGHGSYNVSRFGGMNYNFDSSSTGSQTFRVVVESSDRSTTYCAGYYTK